MLCDCSDEAFGAATSWGGANWANERRHVVTLNQIQTCTVIYCNILCIYICVFNMYNINIWWNMSAGENFAPGLSMVPVVPSVLSAGMVFFIGDGWFLKPAACVSRFSDACRTGQKSKYFPIHFVRCVYVFLFFWSALICFKAATDKTCPPQRTAQLQLDKLGIIVRSLRSLGPARPRARELPWRA